MTKPLCMTDPEYALWTAANMTISNPRVRAVRPCSDCPMAYFHAMREVGRCDGYPNMRAGRVDTPEARDRLAARREQWRVAQARRRSVAAA